MAKTQLFVRKQPGGVFSIYDEGKTTGNVYWVDSGSSSGADSAGYGNNPDAPLLTLDYAIGLCTANNGDRIFLMPGHAETLVAATSCVADIAGVKIIGLGAGSDRPTLTIGTAATATVSVTAANVWFENVLFVCGLDGLNGAITVSGNDATFIGCEFRDATDVEADIWIDASGDRLTVKDCFFNGYTGGDQQEAMIDLDSVDGALVENTRFLGKVITACVNISVASTNLVVKDSVFYRATTTDLSLDVVDTATGSTWAVLNCYDLGAGKSFSGGSGASGVAGDDVGAVSTGVSTNTSFLTAGSTALSTVNSIATTASAGVSTVNSLVTTVSAGVSTNTSRLTAESTMLNTISTAVSTVNSIATTASAGVSTVNSIATTISAGVSTVNSITTTASAGVSTVNSIATTVSTGVNTVSTAVSTVNSIVTTVSAGVSTNTSRLTANSAAISTIDSIVTTASAGVSTVNSIVTTVSAGVSTVNSIVTTISAGVSTVSSIITVVNAWDVRTVSKAAIALDAGTVNNVFTVSNGPIIIDGLFLLVTTAVSANNCTMKWQNDPDLAVAATTDLCGTVDLISAAIGDIFATVGASGSAAVKYASGTATGLLNTTGALAQAGAINLVLANADPTTGIGTAYLVYRPLASNATVTAP